MPNHDTQRSSRVLHLPGASSESTPAEPQPLDLRDYVAIFLRRRRLMVITIGIALALCALYTLLQKPLFEATTKILVNPAGKSSGGAESIAALSDLKALTQGRSVDTQVEIVGSRDMLEQAYGGLAPDERLRGFGSAKLPPWAVTVQARKNTDIIEITVRAYTSEAAARLADTIATTYFARDLEESNQATRQVRKYVENNLAKVQGDLTQADRALAQYKQQSGLIAPSTQLIKVAEMAATTQLNLQEARAQIAASDQSLAILREQMSGEQATVIADTQVTRNPRFTGILGNIDALEAQRADLLQEYTEQSPEVAAVTGRIHAAEGQLSDVAQTIVASETRARNPIRDGLVKSFSDGLATRAAATARAGVLDKYLAEAKAAAALLPERERMVTELMQQAKMLKDTHAMLTGKYHELLLSEQGTLPNGRLVDHAHTAAVPVRPQPMRNAVLFLLLGGVVAAALAMIAERLDDRVHDQEAAEQIAFASTLAVVPTVSGDAPRLISQTERHSPLLESFRILRNNIAFAGIDRRMRVLAVSSAGPGEGKSTVCANLALAMAMDGRSVVVVDCDLRKPSMHTLMGTDREVGFTSVVTGACTLREAVVPTATEGLSFLPTGPLPPNPTEVLNSQASRNVLATLAEEYDVVLVDCPPSTGLSDIQVIAQLIDGLLLVVSMDQTLKTQLGLTIRTLAQAEAPLIGLVVNRLDMKRQGNYYYYYYAEQEGADRKTRRGKKDKAA